MKNFIGTASGIVNLYAQDHEGGPAFIAADRAGLLALRAAVDAALHSGRGQRSPRAGDGEGFGLNIVRVEGDAMARMACDYRDPTSTDYRLDDTINRLYDVCYPTCPAPAADTGREFLMDQDGYPTPATLRTVHDWPFSDGLAPLLDAVADLFRRHGWARVEDGKYELVTGGWSGNEALIGALQSNYVVWAMCWFSSERGGRHDFELPPRD